MYTEALLSQKNVKQNLNRKTKSAESASLQTQHGIHSDFLHQVNGTVVIPPVTSIIGVNIYLSGKFVVLETSFGLRIRFDGNHHADVTIPSSYSGLLCGLCGKIYQTSNVGVNKINQENKSYKYCVYSILCILDGIL